MGVGIRAGLNDCLFNGALADCRVYGRTLTAAEISTLFANGAGGPTPAPGLFPPANLQAHPPTLSQ